MPQYRHGDGRLRLDAAARATAKEPYYAATCLWLNKDQVKGAIKEAAGKLQQTTGKVVGSKEQQAKGLVTKVEGQAQKKAGEAKEALTEARSTL